MMVLGRWDSACLTAEMMLNVMVLDLWRSLQYLWRRTIFSLEEYHLADFTCAFWLAASSRWQLLGIGPMLGPWRPVLVEIYTHLTNHTTFQDIRGICVTHWRLELYTAFSKSDWRHLDLLLDWVGFAVPDIKTWAISGHLCFCIDRWVWDLSDQQVSCWFLNKKYIRCTPFPPSETGIILLTIQYSRQYTESWVLTIILNNVNFSSLQFISSALPLAGGAYPVRGEWSRRPRRPRRRPSTFASNHYSSKTTGQIFFKLWKPTPRRVLSRFFCNLL